VPQFVVQRSLSEPPAPASEPASFAQAAPRELGVQVRWIKSYVTERNIYCLYDAPSEALLRAHARARGFPVEVIERVWAVSSTNAGAH
jgi:Protein of unknown function (DUF4242)